MQEQLKVVNDWSYAEIHTINILQQNNFSDRTCLNHKYSKQL